MREAADKGGSILTPLDRIHVFRDTPLDISVGRILLHQGQVQEQRTQFPLHSRYTFEFTLFPETVSLENETSRRAGVGMSGDKTSKKVLEYIGRADAPFVFARWGFAGAMSTIKIQCARHLLT